MDKGWQSKYRYAKAFEKASVNIIQTLTSLQSQYEMLLKKEKEVEESIEDA